MAANTTAATESERRAVFQSLRTYSKRELGSPEAVNRYEERITCGKDENWTRQLALSLQEETPDIFAGLGDDEPKKENTQAPDVAALLRMADEGDRISSAESRRGQPRKPADSAAILARIKGLDKQNGVSKEQKHLVAVTEPYVPCLTPLEQLKTIKLSDLDQETHHRGKAIIVKRSGALARDGVALLGAIEDDDGDIESIELHHIVYEVAEHLLREESKFAIKDPYFTIRADGSAVLRIDHPTDIVPISEELRSLADTKTAAEWKQVGNDKLGQKQLWKAREAYWNGLTKASDSESRLKLDLSRNLARVDLDLGRFDEARDSASRAVSDGSDPALTSLDVKALYRAASASYQLRQYQKSAEYLDKLLQLESSDTDGNRDSQKVKDRIAEHDSGLYDFVKIASKLSASNPRADIADYTQAVEVGKSSTGGGRGLFATRDLALGELILCEKAFCSVFEKDKTYYAAWEYNNGKLSMAASTMALWDIAVHRLLQNSSEVPSFTTLRGNYEGLASDEVKVDHETVIDTFQIQSIISSNAFGVPTPVKSRSARPFGYTAEHQGTNQLGDNTALFLKVSMMNHSCVPNVRKAFIGDVIIIRATRSIKKGEEILQSYAQTDADVKERREMLEGTWGFKCECKLCTVEDKEQEEKRRSREEMERRANELGVAIKNAAVSGSDVSKADPLLKSIKASYDAELYKHLPRKASTYLFLGLIHHYKRQNQRSRCLLTMNSLFDALGWNFDCSGDKAEFASKDDCETHIMPDLVDVVLIARSLQRKPSGKNKQAKRLEEIARELYVAVNGSICGWEELLKSSP